MLEGQAGVLAGCLIQVALAGVGDVVAGTHGHLTLRWARVATLTGCKDENLVEAYFFIIYY